MCLNCHARAPVRVFEHGPVLGALILAAGSWVLSLAALAAGARLALVPAAALPCLAAAAAARALTARRVCAKCLSDRLAHRTPPPVRAPRLSPQQAMRAWRPHRRSWWAPTVAFTVTLMAIVLAWWWM